MNVTCLIFLGLVALASSMSVYNKAKDIEENKFVLGKMRRGIVPTKIAKNMTNMSVESKTSKMVSTKGWADEPGCNRYVAVFEIESEFTSPRYPRNYPNSAHCEYLIQAPAGKSVQLSILECDIEHQMDCSWDSLCIYDGSDEMASQVVCYCGEIDDLVLVSESSALFVVFHSDISERHRGFKATWTFIDTQTTSHNDQGSGSNYFGNYDYSGDFDYSGDYEYSGNYVDFTPAPPCDQTLSGQSGIFTSPKEQGSNHYPNNAHCVFSITVAEGKRVHLRFENFHLEFEEFCSFDRVEIHDGLGENNTPVVGQVQCGLFAPADTTSSGRSVSLVFISDHSITGTGFTVHWTAVGNANAPAPQLPVPSPASPSPPGTPSCGVPAIQARFRIVGGVVAEAHSWPWQISLRHHNRHICGGSIISNDWVVTAAHCVDGNPDPNNFKVRIGEHDFNSDEASQQDIQVNLIVAHERYNSNTMDNDVAVLKLATPITFTDKVSPVCLAAADAQERLLCTTTGWGTTLGTGNGNILQQVNVPIIALNTCNSMYEGRITNTMLCAGFPEGGKDSCQGDSGGPLVCRNPAGTHYSLYGITSWGFGCAEANAPGIYSRVSRLTGWIEAKTGVSPQP